MSPILLAVIIGIAALIIGVLAGKFIFSQNSINEKAEAAHASAEARLKLESAQHEADRIVKEAELKGDAYRKQRELEAKERFLQLKSKHEEEVTVRNAKVVENEARIKQQNQNLVERTEAIKKQSLDSDRDREKLTRGLEELNTKTETLNARQAELDKAHNKHVHRLEKIANLTAEEARNQIIDTIKEEARTAAMSHVKDIMEEAKVNANREAKKIIIQSIQRTAAEHTIENAITVFNLESDEMKGQIIGREGRNIRALEAATGVDLIIDDTPEAIVLSCFDPLRREIARLSLQKLVQDGRIHPARIEEVVEKTRKALEDQIMEIGERTIIELGVHGLHKDLVRMVGKMRFPLLLWPEPADALQGNG